MKTQNTPLLKFKEKIAYASGDFASNLSFHVINVFLMVYLTDVFGLNAAAVGLMLFVGGIWDAINDPMMGAIADRTNTTSGKYRPYLKWFAIPYGVLFYAVFAGPELGELGKLIFVWTTYISIKMVYTAINVPYSALMGVMSPNSDDRVSLSTFRFMGAFGAQLLVVLLTLPLIGLIGAGDEQKGWSITMAIFAVLSVLMFLFCFKNTKERIKPQPQVKVHVKDDIKFLLGNLPFLIMAVAGICTLANVAIRNAVTVYYFKYVIGVGEGPVFSLNLGLFPLDFDIITVFMTTGSIAFLIGCAFSGHVGKLFGKRNGLIFLTLINAVAVISFYVIPPESVNLIFMVNIFASLVAGPTPAIVWALYTDVADYNEWKFNRRSTGLIFSATMFAQKFGYTIGASAAASMLALFGYVANQAQTPEALNGILMMYSIIPGGLALINGIILFWFPLTQKQTDMIQAELEVRRAAN